MRTRDHRNTGLAHALVACTGLFVGGAHGATIAVPCDTAALINAIDVANTTPGADTLQLFEGCVYTLTTSNNNWYGPNGLPAITSDITIVGNGAKIERSANAGMPPFRLFHVAGNWSGMPRGRLTLRDLGIFTGIARGGSSLQGGAGAGMGGAIFNQGDLVLSGVTLSSNQAIGGNGGAAGLGSGGGGMGEDAGSANGGGFGAFAGGFGGAGGSGAATGGGGGGGGFAPTSNGGNGTPAAGGMGGGNSGWGDGAGDAGDGGFSVGALQAGAGGSFGFGGQAGGAGGGGGVGGGGAGSAGGGGGFGGGGGAAAAAGGSGGFGGGSGGGLTSSGQPGFGGGVGSGLSGGGGAGMGGAIFNLGGSVSILNCTLTGNAAIGGLSGGVSTLHGSGMGGAIFNLQGDVDIEHATIAFNRVNVDANGGAIYNLGYLGGSGIGGIGMVSSLTLVNSILSNSLSDTVGIADLVNMQPTLMANGSPNIATATVDLSQPDIVLVISNNGGAVIGTPSSIDPNLGPLANNGGPTPTLALSAGSSAIDAGASTGLTTDQRGVARPFGPAPDLGAFEFTIDDVIFRDGFD